MFGFKNNFGKGHVMKFIFLIITFLFLTACSSKPYLEFGWGDKYFYQAENPTVGLGIKAILWSTKSVVHVVALPLRPDEYFS